MKRKLTVAICTIMASITICGCAKKDSATPSSPYKMTASIGGTPFSRDSCVFSQNILDTTDVQIIGWAGYPLNGPNYYPIIHLYFSYAYHGVGTYPISSSIYNAKLETSSTSGSYAVSGTMTITSNFPTVVGTFSFTTATGVVVSNGSFTALRDYEVWVTNGTF